MSKKSKETGWVKVPSAASADLPDCDLCGRRAVWKHPEGGFRCRQCPRPEAK